MEWLLIIMMFGDGKELEIVPTRYQSFEQCDIAATDLKSTGWRTLEAVCIMVPREPTL
jgi:hypothetical protein